jgi:UPF0271 protein
MRSVDLNCDMGESFGAWRMGADDAVMPHITSANIACGFHGGDPGVMRRTVAAAKSAGVAIGAHPGLPDLVGFGRRTMDVTPAEVYDLVVYQIGALSAFASAAGVKLQHVKPHGALYNMAAADVELSDAIAEAVRDADRTLMLFGLAGSPMIHAGERAGLRTAQEVFADRNYMSDGSLVSRRRDDAMVTEVAEAADRALMMVREGKVRTVEDSVISIHADTICIHGDGTHAVAFARAIRSRLEDAGIAVRALVR